MCCGRGIAIYILERSLSGRWVARHHMGPAKACWAKSQTLSWEKVSRHQWFLSLRCCLELLPTGDGAPGVRHHMHFSHRLDCHTVPFGTYMKLTQYYLSGLSEASPATWLLCGAAQPSRAPLGPAGGTRFCPGSRPAAQPGPAPGCPSST